MNLAETISLLAHAVREYEGAKTEQAQWFKSPCGPVTKTDLRELERKIMAVQPAIAAFVEKMNAHNARVSTALDGVTGDVESQAALIKQLQENPGPISAEDQAALDQLQTVNEGLAAKVEALDALTPPTPPPPTPA